MKLTPGPFVELIGSFEELAMTFKAGFRLRLRWFDHRLTFLDLKDDENFIAKTRRSEIWIPLLVFYNSIDLFYVENDPVSTVFIEKQGLLNR